MSSSTAAQPGGPGRIAAIDEPQLDVDQLYDWVAERA
jgi:hypothetical protein